MPDQDRTLGVGELIARRHREGSTPGQRTDSHRLALVIEGGSSRGAYSHGMAMAIEELGVLPVSTRCTGPRRAHSTRPGCCAGAPYKRGGPGIPR